MKAKTRKKRTTLPISAIRQDFQSSECLVQLTVDGYTEQFRRGERVEPIRVRFDGQNYFPEDGFHRLAAARVAGFAEIEAKVLPGTLAEMEARFGRYLKKLKRVLAAPKTEPEESAKSQDRMSKPKKQSLRGDVQDWRRG